MNKLIALSAAALVAFAGMASAGNKLVVAGDDVVIPDAPVVVPGSGLSPIVPALAGVLLLTLLLNDDDNDSSATTTQ